MLGALVDWGGVRSHVSRDRPRLGSYASNAFSACLRSSSRASLADILTRNVTIPKYGDSFFSMGFLYWFT